MTPAARAGRCARCGYTGRPLTTAGWCPECADVACGAGDGDRVGLPVPADVDAAVAALARHVDECDVDDPTACPVCAFASIVCTECDRATDLIMRDGDWEAHRFSDDDEWVIVGCEGYVFPIVRAAAVWAAEQDAA